MGGLSFNAKYPFTSSAKDYVSKMGVEIALGMVERAEARVRAALLNGKIPKFAELPSAMEEELALYAISRMIVSSADNRYLINRYAVAEAKRASDYLSSDDAARPENIDEVAGEFGVSFEKSKNAYLVPLASYLAYTPRSIDYKLTNREVTAGKVRVNRHERVRILEEAVRKRIEGSLPIRAQFPPEVVEAGKRMLSLLPKLETAIVKLGQENYPPCIRRLVEDLSLNVNVPHTGRVALAIYLINAGMQDGKIAELFRHAPDFSEKTTKYQVEYLRAKKYRMPSCATMDSYGACVAECRCGSPLNYRANMHGARLARLADERKE